MNENVKAFLEAAQARPDLQEKLVRMDKDELIATARDLGVELTDADFEPPAGEVDAADLENVVGGWGICILAGGGGGTDDMDGNTYGCGCAVYGQGGDGRPSDSNCVCLILGGGASNEQFYKRW